MSTNHYTEITTSFSFQASQINVPLGELDAAITTNATDIAINATAINGTAVHDMASDADYTLSADDLSNKVVEITDTGTNLTTTRNIIVPAASKVFYFVNSTAQSLVPKTSGGTGPTVTTGQEGWLRCDGTNVVQMTPSW
jgi:hypothetical protein